jgi:hypothetical protein
MNILIELCDMMELAKENMVSSIHNFGCVMIGCKIKIE